MTEQNKRILVAEIATVHGVRGLVKLRSHCEDPDLIDGICPLFTSPDGEQTLDITLEREIGAYMWLASVDGITDRTAAEKLRGTKLYLPREEFPDIDEERSYYHIDLVGLEARDQSGQIIGKVFNVANFGAGDLLEIKPSAGGQTYYLPFTDTYVPQVDIKGGFVTIFPDPDLIDPK